MFASWPVIIIPSLKYSKTNLKFQFFTVIEQEKTQNNLLSGIENFDTNKLKHAETQEKNPLPTKEIIDQEKSA